MTVEPNKGTDGPGSKVMAPISNSVLEVKQEGFAADMKEVKGDIRAVKVHLGKINVSLALLSERGRGATMLVGALGAAIPTGIGAVVALLLILR